MNPFKRFRKDNGYTQEAVAEIVGTDSSTVAKWESGKSLPRARLLLPLAQLYRCTVDDLLKDEPARSKHTA